MLYENAFENGVCKILINTKLARFNLAHSLS